MIKLFKTYHMFKKLIFAGIIASNCTKGFIVVMIITSIILLGIVKLFGFIGVSTTLVMLIIYHLLHPNEFDDN